MNTFVRESDRLIGPGAEPVLEAAIRYSGGELGPWTIPFHERTNAGDLAIVCQADVWWNPEDPESEVVSERFGLYTRQVGQPLHPDRNEESLVVTNGELAVRVWRFPHDPWLTSLAPFGDPETVGAALEQLGLHVDSTGSTELLVHSYRPRRRAVLELETSSGAAFIKVTDPETNTSLVKAHAALRAAGLPVPEVLAHGEGVHVLRGLDGISLSRAIRAHGQDAVDPTALVELAQGLDRVAVEFIETRPFVDYYEWLTHLVGITRLGVPRLAERVERLADRLSPALDDIDELVHDEPVLIHGDFHTSQIFVRDGEITGLLDLDDLRRGRRAEDLGALLAYLSADAAWSYRPDDPSAFTTYTALAERMYETFANAVEPWELATMASLWSFERMSVVETVEHRGWQPQMEKTLLVAEHWCDIAEGSRTVEDLMEGLSDIPDVHLPGSDGSE